MSQPGSQFAKVTPIRAVAIGAVLTGILKRQGLMPYQYRLLRLLTGKTSGGIFLTK